MKKVSMFLMVIAVAVFGANYANAAATQQTNSNVNCSYIDQNGNKGYNCDRLGGDYTDGGGSGGSTANNTGTKSSTTTSKTNTSANTKTNTTTGTNTKTNTTTKNTSTNNTTTKKADTKTETKTGTKTGAGSSTSTKTTFKVIKYGMSSKEVTDVQNALTTKKHFKAKVDGKFGVDTLNAVKAFQKANKLKVDGIVGESTFDLLMK